MKRTKTDNNCYVSHSGYNNSSCPQSNISIDFNDPPIGLEPWQEEGEQEYSEAHLALKELIINQVNQIPISSFNYVLQQVKRSQSARTSLNVSHQLEQLKAEVERLKEENSKLQISLTHEKKLRRSYYNELQILKGAIRIYLRVRPLLSNETNDSFITKFSNKTNQVLYFPKVLLQQQGNENEMMSNENDKKYISNYRKFNFDRIISPSVHQQQLYNEEISELTKSVIDGYNVAIFCYGQTGTGKTYTMQGNGEEYGLQQFILKDLYQSRNDLGLNIGISCLEIYNETCIDLLRSSENKLELKTDPKTQKVFAQGLREVPCQSLDEALQCLVFAQKNRAVACTNQNARSSRSHFIVQINVMKQDESNEEGNTSVSTLYLIDLAGSEKISTNSNPLLDAETKHINKSLSTLGNVMENLRSKSQKSNNNGHVPYRDSKLTFLMSNVFRDKHAIVCMIPHIAPSSGCFYESLRTLQFAERMSGIALVQANQ
ncbi:hypothetical protein ABK040_003661 [Willaertia magna]